MNILAYNWRDLAHPQAGGAEVYIQSVGAEWANSGHAVTLFCAAVEGKPESEVVDGVRLIRRGSRFGVYRAARRYWEKEGKGNFDLVVDCVNTRPFMCPRFVQDVPVVAVIHQVAKEIWSYEMPWPISWIGRYLLEPKWLGAYRDASVVTLSESSRTSLEAYGLRDVKVIPVGWQPREWQDDVDKEPSPTVVFVGRLSSNKRPEHAIEAFKLVRHEFPDAQMWIIGAGPEEETLQAKAPAGVTFFGHLTEAEKRDRLARAHVLVATSVREGWGLVVTEAAAVGTATVGYDVPGLRDSIPASGGVLTAADPTSLGAELARQFASNPADRTLDPKVGGVCPWEEVAGAILTTAAEAWPISSVGRLRRPADHSWASAWRARFAVLGVLALFLLSGAGRDRFLRRIASHRHHESR